MTTLPQQDTIKQYVANGVTTNFTVPFYTPLSSINDSPAIDVYVTLSGQTPIPEDDIKIWNVDFTYTPNVDPTTGGQVVFLEGKIPPLSSIVTLSRDVPAELTVEFSDAQNFSGANLDNVLLQLLLIEQQNKTYALSRNLSYRVNSFLPDAVIQANTQIPVLAQNQIWQGTGNGVAAVTLEEKPDVSTLRSQLLNNSPGTDGALIVGFYDLLNLAATTVHAQLALLTSNVRLMGTDSGTTNSLVLTLANNTATYVTGLEIRIIAANTNTNAPTINFNGFGAKNIYRDATYPAQPGDFISGKLYTLVYDGTKFIMENPSSIPSGVSVDYMGGAVKPGFLLEDGSAVSRTIYAALFAAIGTIWGVGDGATTFNLPNSQRRSKVGSGGTASPVLQNTVGSTGGSENPTLVEHSHPSTNGEFISKVGGGGTYNFGAGGLNNVVATNTANAGDASSTGKNIPPSMVVTAMIKI